MHTPAFTLCVHMGICHVKGTNYGKDGHTPFFYDGTWPFPIWGLEMLGIIFIVGGNFEITFSAMSLTANVIYVTQMSIP